MKEYEVHFRLSGSMVIEAETEEKAREITNYLINNKIYEFESMLCCGLIDDDYTTDVIELGEVDE